MMYSAAFGSETLIVVWYAVYMQDRYHANTAIASAQIAIVCFSAMVAMKLVQDLCAQARERFLYLECVEEDEEEIDEKSSEDVIVEKKKCCGDILHNHPHEYNSTHLFIVLSMSAFILFLTTLIRLQSSNQWFNAETYNYFGKYFF